MLTIDPGLDTGWALFANGELLSCGVCAPRDVPRVGPAEMVVIEWPIARSWGRRAGGSALVELAAHAGEALGACGAVAVRKVAPHEWKGSIPKPPDGAVENYIIWRRASAVLSQGEREIAERTMIRLTRSQALDCADAIGLGLFASGRLGRGLQ